ncbi:MAG: hypothetical protein H6907_04180 [Hyphomicrobiales bacterium]|nr:hypothetical protein [Hyphomicrobiales bacterium]
METKAVTFGDFTMELPATWGFERLDEHVWWWGEGAGLPGVQMGWDRYPVGPPGAPVGQRVRPALDAIREAFGDKPWVRGLHVIPHAEGAVVRVVLAPDPKGVAEIRWYTILVPEGDGPAPMLRLRLNLAEADLDTDRARTLDGLFHNQALAVRRRPPGDRAARPPADAFAGLRRATFAGAVTCDIPLAWIVRRQAPRVWWCASDQFMGSLNLALFWTAGDPDTLDLPRSLTASADKVAGILTEDQPLRSSVAEDLPGGRLRHDTCDVGTLDDPPEGDDMPVRSFTWARAQVVEGGIVTAGFDLMVPLHQVDAPAYRDLVAVLDRSVRGADLAPPPPAGATALDDAARRFDLHRLRAQTCFDFLNICVPRRWIWEQSDGAWGFFPRDGTEDSGVMWVDHDFLSAGKEVGRDRTVTAARRARDRAATRFAGEFGPHVVIRSEDTDEGGVLWITHDAEEDGEELRFHRCHRFLARKRGVLILHFNLVLLESQADDPEMVELVQTVTREIEAARIL